MEQLHSGFLSEKSWGGGGWRGCWFGAEVTPHHRGAPGWAPMGAPRLPDVAQRGLTECTALPLNPGKGTQKKTFCTRPGHDRFPISHPEGAGGVTSMGQPLQPLHPNPCSTRSSAGKRSQQQPAGNTGKRPRGRVLQNVGPVVPWAKAKGSDPAALAWARRIPAPGVTAPSSCCSAPRAAALFGEQAEPVPGWISPLLCLLRQRAAGSFTPCQLWLFSLPVWAFGTGLHLSPRQGPATTGHQHSSPAPTVPPQHLEVLSSALQKKKTSPKPFHPLLHGLILPRCLLLARSPQRATVGWGRDPAPPTPLGVLPSGLHHSPNPLQLPP